ncbi:MAG: glycosyltransferase family 39 protein, partial [Chloroflexota bacterium]
MAQNKNPQPKNYARLFEFAGIVFLLIIAYMLRMENLDTKGLWIDELTTASFSFPNLPLSKVIQNAASTPIPSPPFIFVVTHYLFKIFGVSDLIVRIPSIIAGVLGVWATYLLGKTARNIKVGWAGA